MIRAVLPRRPALANYDPLERDVSVVSSSVRSDVYPAFDCTGALLNYPEADSSPTVIEKIAIASPAH